MTERTIWFERRRDIYDEWINLLESTSKNDPAGRIAVAEDTDNAYDDGGCDTLPSFTST